MNYREKYLEYLKSDKWKSIRESLFKERGKKCERYNPKTCSNKIEVHHKTYKNIFNEKLKDLEVLCINCHRKEHNIGDAIKAIRLIKNDGVNFFINYYNKRSIKYKGPVTKKSSVTRQRNTQGKNRNERINEELENKGKIIRRLNKLGIKEIEGRKLYYFDCDYLKKYLNTKVK